MRAAATPRRVKAAWAKVTQRRGGGVAGKGLLGAGEGGGEEEQEREVGGEGVVLLVGGEGEEDEDEGGEEGEEKGGATSPGVEMAEAEEEAWPRRADERIALVARGASATNAEEDGQRKEEAPGKEPDEVEAPVEVAGELVVVHGDAPAEEAEEVLVDEVEPEEAVAVHAAGVAQAGEDVPGGGDGEEEEHAGEGFEAAPGFQSPVRSEVDEGGPKKKTRATRPLVRTARARAVQRA